MHLASALALLVALIFVGPRLASLWFLANLLSRPILVGYLTGVGNNVALSHPGDDEDEHPGLGHDLGGVAQYWFTSP